MPGGSFCCIVDCHVSSTKCRGVSFHRIPRRGVSEEINEWRKKLINAVNRCDKSFNCEKAKICSRHFTEDCFITKPSGRRDLIQGSLPTKFMPKKSVETPKIEPRKPPCQRGPPDVPADDSSYEADTSCTEACHNSCPGIMDYELQCFAKLPPTTDSLEKSPSPYYLDVTYHRQGEFTTCSTTIRAQACKRSVESASQICKACLHAKHLVLKKKIRRAITEKQTLKKHAPLSKVSKSRVKNALKFARLQNKEALKQLHEIREKLRKESVEVSDSAHQRLTNIMRNSKLQENSFIQKFWTEQQKAFCRKTGGMRWHPMMVRFAILLHSQSPSAYRCLRDVGVLRLPAESTLRDYTNVIHPQEGFNIHVFLELKQMTKNLTDHERWVCLLHDEISIKSGLVYDRRSGELVGFLSDEQKTAKSAQDNHLASHALVFMVVGVTSNIKMSLGYFPTRTATADCLFPLLWKAVGLLECVCNLKVIASTSDKAAPNQRLIKLHGSFYKARNLFSPDRYVFFFSDAPHLIKTVRNNLASSGWGKNSRQLWNNGSELLWTHVRELYIEDSQRQVRRTRLTSEHIYLTPQSVMRVYLAAQVLSNTVGRVMEVFGGPECKETAKFILLMDKFFDCLNVRSCRCAKENNKTDTTDAKNYLLPYTSLDDARFKFLSEEFLGYIESWKASVDARQGFKKMEKNKMFLSQQSYDGLKTTVHSVIEATKFLIQSGVKFVLTHKFCQDPLEEHFGRHRSMGIRSDNPTLWTYGYQENKLRLQRSLALAILPKGNIRGKRKSNIVEVDETPLPKIKRKH